VPEHALDRQMGLAGICGAKNRGQVMAWGCFCCWHGDLISFVFFSICRFILFSQAKGMKRRKKQCYKVVCLTELTQFFNLLISLKN